MYCSILDYFEETVEKNPDKVAVEMGENRLSFETLRFQSYQVAERILEVVGECQRKPIAILLPKSINIVSADLGVVYSGNVFMNLDTGIPSERLEAILQNIKPIAVLTTKEYIEKFYLVLQEYLVVDIATVEDINIKSHKELVLRRENYIDTDPFCIINTSGSTGTPKGVVLNHKSFFDFVIWAEEVFAHSENAIMGSLSPTIFDIYVYELCAMAMFGATIILLDSRLSAFPIRLLQEVEVKGVNFIFWVPSIMVNIANMNLLEKVDMSMLKNIWFAGEVFPTKQFNYWRKKLPAAVFVNLYGPIEITLDCTYYIANHELTDDEPLPIGIPCKNTEVLILNADDKLCEIGEEGELCVRGTSLAMGYYNDTEKTEAVFVQNPLNRNYPELIYRTGDMVYRRENGEIIFRGRKDSLIKHMGYRIELTEIEHVLINKLKIVKYCCAVYHVGKKEIVLFYEGEEDIENVNFRKQLLTIFPKYMLPARYIRLEELPRNTNGKIDRQTLKEKINSEV